MAPFDKLLHQSHDDHMIITSCAVCVKVILGVLKQWWFVHTVCLAGRLLWLVESMVGIQ